MGGTIRSVGAAKPRILIAEDDPAVAALLAEGLGAHGFATTVVHDGRNAFHRAATEDFGVVILDIGIPGLDGLEVLHRLRAHGRLMPILILSASDSLQERVAGLYAGADDYIGKPFDLDEVVARIRARIRHGAT
jgi:two-component system, OmpR family, response regulator